MNKLPVLNSLDLWRDDPGFPVSLEIMQDTFVDYRWHHKLPEAGGWFDQDTHWCDAVKLLDDMVEWYKLDDPKRANLPTMEDIFAERRKQFQGDD